MQAKPWLSKVRPTASNHSKRNRCPLSLSGLSAASTCDRFLYDNTAHSISDRAMDCVSLPSRIGLPVVDTGLPVVDTGLSKVKPSRTVIRVSCLQYTVVLFK